MRLLSRLVVFLTIYLSTFLFVAFWKMHFLHGSAEEFLHLKIMNELPQRRRPFSFSMKPLKINPDTPRSAVLKLNDPTATDIRWSMVVFVKSHSSHRSRRMLARMTWASFEYLDGIRIEAVFIVGKAENTKEQTELAEENEKYGDLLQLDIIEKYTSVGFKSLAGMQYASAHFPADWIYVSSDDDIMPDMIQFQEKLSKMREGASQSNNDITAACEYTRHTAIVCGFGCVVNALPKREKESKWFIEVADYPLPTYPSYCLGGLYGMSVKLATDLYELSRTLPFFWIDDVWITGFLRLKHFVSLKPKCESIDADVGMWSTSSDATSSTGAEHDLLQAWTQYVAKVHEKKFTYANDQTGQNESNHLPFEFKAWLEYVFHDKPKES